MAKHAYLLAEIERILLAPYPASLRILSAILEQTDDSVLITWAISKPCQVAPLLDVLVSRTNGEADASNALTSVLRCPTVFGTFLLQHKSALERFYSRQLRILCSEASSHHFASHQNEQTPMQAADSQALLRAPYILPPTSGIPSSYYAYLERLIRGSEGESLGQWQARLYGFFADAPLDLLSALSESTIQFASDRWKTLMRSENLAENLYAGYISCKLQRHAAVLIHNDSSPGSCPAICPTLRDWVMKCHFTFQNDQKCVDVVKKTLARVLALTYYEKYRNVANADVAITLAGDILTVAREHYPRDWVNDTGKYTRKIAEKFGGARVCLQVASVHILAVLEPNAWLFGAVDICTKVLQILTAAASGYEVSPHPQGLSAGTMLHAADQSMTLTSIDQSAHVFSSFVKHLCDFIIEQCHPNVETTSSRLAGIAQALRFVEGLQALERRGPSTMATVFVKAVAAVGIPEWWTLNLRTPGSPENCCGLLSCVHYEEIQRQRLCDQVSLVLFSCSSADGRQLPRSTIELLGQRLSQGCLGDERPTCAYYPILRLQQALNTCQQPDITSHNWRAYLGEALRSSNDQNHNLVENLITMICKDLEDRCHTAEVPLRVAHGKVHELTEAIEHLENKISSMALDKTRLEEALLSQQQARDDDYSLAAELEQTITNLKQQLNEAQWQMKRMQLDKGAADQQSRQQCDELQQKAQEDIEIARHQHATKVCELESKLSSQVQANNALEHESAWLKEQTDLARNELVAAHTEQIEQLNDQYTEETGNLKLQISQLQDNAFISAQDLARLNEEIQARDQTIEELTRLHNESKTQVSRLQSELQTANPDKTAISTELADAQSTNKDLSDELATRVGEIEKQGQRISELEIIATQSQQRCAKLEKALTEARQREEGISALLAGGASASGVSTRRTTLTAPAMRNPTLGFENFSQGGSNMRQTSAPRLPEKPFVSDDDDDYDEIMKLPH